MIKCDIFDELWEEYYKFKEQVDANPEPCCIDDCCEGEGDCGDDCCNEDGNKPMGTCWCKEENQDYKPCDDELLKNLKDADKKLTDHRDKSGCEICIKNLKRKLFE